jgi:aspartate/methionine/tyrosine aminotransferase
MQAAIEGAGLPTLPAYGSYFLMADWTGLDFATDVEFCKFLVTDVGVATVPPSVFYSDPARAPKLARFCFAKQDATIEAAAERLAAARDRLTVATAA